MKNSYDMIVSLGGNCSAAAQLRMRGLRQYSLPFDWLYMESAKSVKYLANGFADGFSRFFLKENLVPLKDVARGGISPYQYRDSLTGFCFIHHFQNPVDAPGGYASVNRTIRKRLGRLFSKICEARKILFLLCTDFPFDPDIAASMISSIRDRWPDKKIDMHLIQFGGKFEDSSITGRQFSGMPFEGAVYARDTSQYDMEFTSAEWGFLDNIELSGVQKRPFRGSDRVRYKIWKSISKRFLNGGFALKGVSFR